MRETKWNPAASTGVNNENDVDSTRDYVDKELIQNPIEDDLLYSENVS